MSELRENFEKSFIHFDAAEYWNENLNDYEERDCSVAWRYYQAGYAQAMKEVSEVEPVAYIYPAAYGSRASLCKNNKPVGWDDEDNTEWYEHPLIPRPKGTDHE